MLRNIFKPKREKLPIHKVSFSQCGEDLIIDHVFTARDVVNPTYIDVGAYNPWRLNNTAKFYLEGSKGINIEPDPSSYSKFLTDREKDVNLNIGIGPEDAELTYYKLSKKGLSSFSKQEVDKVLEDNEGVQIIETFPVKIKTLDFVVDEYLDGKYPNFVSIDVEGLELDILKSINWDNPYLPDIFCVETISFSATGKGVKNDEIINFIKSKGYLGYADTNINTIFVKEGFWVIS